MIRNRVTFGVRTVNNNIELGKLQCGGLVIGGPAPGVSVHMDVLDQLLLVKDMRRLAYRNKIDYS
jgi:hypothetical protein